MVLEIPELASRADHIPSPPPLLISHHQQMNIPNALQTQCPHQTPSDPEHRRAPTEACIRWVMSAAAEEQDGCSRGLSSPTGSKAQSPSKAPTPPHPVVLLAGWVSQSGWRQVTGSVWFHRDAPAPPFCHCDKRSPCSLPPHQMMSRGPVIPSAHASM